jgi:UDP-N-acetylglucosamine 1-carboxyvinyltransferase
MDVIVIRGGAVLDGEVLVSGSKNAALPLLFSTLLTKERCVLRNVPVLRDIRTTVAVLQHLGARVEQSPDGHEIVVEARDIGCTEAPYDLVKTMRASFLTLGPLLARFGRARVSTPGGCAIGARPVDLHLTGLEKLGARLRIAEGYVEAEAERLRGAKIVLDFPSVGATQQLMMAAALAEGTTVIENAAREPEVGDLATLLTAMGARLHGVGTDRIEIEGVRELHGAVHRIVPDRIEAGTLLVAGAITQGDVRVTDMVPAHVAAVLSKLEECGVAVEVGPTWVRARGQGRARPTDIVTSPFPGFPTDMQAQLMTLLGLADGQSKLTETIFENRYMHVAELARMGARIITDGSVAIIRGVAAYQGAPVMASDLRASAALVLAGVAGRGRTEVSRIYHLDRGYERLENKLGMLGARIERLT